MLTFFSKIRKGLLGSGQAGKPASNNVERYLLYAVGEIALVVIGILIAVQINNWNNDRINRNKKDVLVKAILLDFKTKRTSFD